MLALRVRCLRLPPSALAAVLLAGAALAQSGAPSASRASPGRAAAPSAQSADPAVQHEIARLASHDRVTRLEAARRLRDAALLQRGRGFHGVSAALCTALLRGGEDPRVLAFLLEVLEKLEEPACADALTSLLRHESAQIRAGACELAARALAPTSVAPRLIELLADPVAPVRASAARALGTLRGAGVKTPLLRALRDADEGVRKHALIALVTAAEPGTLEALVDVLADPTAPARLQARLALVELTGQDHGHDARAWKSALASDAGAPNAGASPASRELAKHVQQIRIQLGSARAADRLAGLQQVRLALQRSGAAATLDALFADFDRALADADPAVRREMLVLLQNFHDPRLVDPLIRTLREDPPLRAQALLALPDVDDRRVRDVLVELLADESQTTVATALERLRRHRDPALVPAVIAALRTATHLHVYDAAAALLTDVGTPVVEPLVRAWPRENANVRRVAAQVLGAVGDERALDVLLAGLEESDYFVRTNSAEALKKLDARGVHAAVRARAGHADAGVRGRSLEILGAQRAPDALDALVAGLQDRDASVQRAAAQALGELRDARAAAPLVAAIGAARFGARAEAAKALARLPADPTVGLVAAALPGAGADAREFLIMALREIGAPARGALLALLDGADAALKLEAAEALSYQVSAPHGGQRDERVVDRLVSFAREDRAFQTSDANERAFFLQRLEDPRAVRLLLETTRATQGEVPSTLTQVLGKHDQPMVASVLIAALRDEDVALRRAAACILGYASSPAAVEPLLAAFDDPDARVRAWAVWSVGSSYAYLRGSLDTASLARRLVAVLQKRSESADVRARAAEALGRIRDDGNDPALVAVLTDAREPVALRVQVARTLQGSSYAPAAAALADVKSRASEPAELREACMTPKEILELHARKRR